MNAENSKQLAATRAKGEKVLPIPELRIVLIYILLASLWIIYSDMALDWLTDDPLIRCVCKPARA